MLGNEIVGTWRLISYAAQDDQGGPVLYPLGAEAVGLIIYTADGYMSAQLMRADRSQAAANDYLAYAGPYRVDEATGAVYHDVTVSLLPTWIGTTQLRHSTLDDDRLTLIAEVPVGDVTIRETLAWERATAHQAVASEHGVTTATHGSSPSGLSSGASSFSG